MSTTRFCPLCDRPRSIHADGCTLEPKRDWTVTRTVSITVTARNQTDAKADADAYPSTAWNIDTEEITAA